MQGKKRIRGIAAILMVMMMLTVCVPSGFASFKVKINSSSAKVYKSPSSSSAHVSGVTGKTLTCTSYSNGWARVTYKGYTGYVKIADLNLTDRVTMYTKSSTPVYKKASGSSKLGTLDAGSKVYAVGYANGYVRIQNKSGSATGYVKSDKVSRSSSYKKKESDSKQSSGGSSSTSKAAKAVATAKDQLGKPYGYSTPNSFNCSSLVKYSYAKAGYSMKSSAAKIAADSRLTKISSISSLKQGDVLCFDTDEDGKCDHVGLFISGNKYIEASQGAGVVRTNKLDSYYKRVFMWARRVK